MRGPYPKEILERIDSAGPAHFPPFNSLDGARTALERAESIKDLPKEYDTYLLHLKKHFRAMVAYYEALDALADNKNVAQFLEKTKPYWTGKKEVSFEALLQKKTKQNLSAEESEQLTELYKGMVQGFPQEEFQNHLLPDNKIEYQCDFDKKAQQDEE